MSVTTIPDLKVTENADFRGPVRFASGAGVERQYFDQDDESVYIVPLSSLVIWDSGQPLPAAAAADDLGHVNGTFGTANNVVNSGDCKAATTTRYARFTVQLPPEYVAGETVKIVLSAGMKTTVAGTSCTIDVEAYKVGRDGLVSGSDLCATAAQSINSLTFADKEFTITPSGLSPGDELDVRVTIACVDGATATAVTPTIGAINLKCDIKG